MEEKWGGDLIYKPPKRLFVRKSTSYRIVQVKILWKNAKSLPA